LYDSETCEVDEHPAKEKKPAVRSTVTRGKRMALAEARLAPLAKRVDDEGRGVMDGVGM